jgi:glycosyltransferase involved in cell wall biosynthesis
MVNQEFYFPKYTLQVDVLLAKTYYAERLLKEYITKIGAPTQVVYLGHTSLVEERGSSEKDWQLCVHFAGNSRYKGTNRLIRMWQAEGGFRKIAPKSRLVITCRDLCHHKIGVELSSLEYDGKGKYHDPRTGLEIYSYLPLEELQRLRQRAGLFLCPSLVEGYGHYINEGAANGSVVITTDFPPMHELVPRNKYLVPPVEIYSSWHVFEPFGFLEPYFIDKHLSTSQAATADMSALASILKDYFLLPTREKEILAETYKEHYRLRREDFETRLGAFLEETRNCSHKS